ncbi:unnamed protein product [Zymoseptoria tritici ST99CH_3D7]|uniref:Uncharacterized protein n=1 Tax=Zymoseptoria tritici (strain ST99CH_3D7) TaxID=1276538 RepID=A0A1X7S017_ZYMT9|nr:unnamed protein product [Zymoseptoria tritici ST99CH_3D7]
MTAPRKPGFRRSGVSVGNCALLTYRRRSTHSDAQPLRGITITNSTTQLAASSLAWSILVCGLTERTPVATTAPVAVPDYGITRALPVNYWRMHCSNTPMRSWQLFKHS